MIFKFVSGLSFWLDSASLTGGCRCSECITIIKIRTSCSPNIRKFPTEENKPLHVFCSFIFQFLCVNVLCNGTPRMEILIYYHARKPQHGNNAAPTNKMDASDDGDPCTGRYPMCVRVVGWIVPRRPRPTATRPPVYVRDGPAFDRLAASRAISTDSTVSEPERERAQVIKTRVVYRRFRSCGNTFPPPPSTICLCVLQTRDR